MTEQAHQSEQWENYNDLSVGEILRRTRISYNMTLEQVEAQVRIRYSHLEAIETNNIEQLPGRVYAIGFVRTYAEYLGLDGDRIVHVFKNQAVGSKPKTELSFPAMQRENQLPGAPYVLGGMVGAILLIFAWSLFYHPSKHLVDPIPAMAVAEDEITEAPPIGIEPPKKDAGEQQQVAAPEEEPLLEPETLVQPPKGVVINVTQNSWVEIRNAQGQAILSTILKPGDQYLVPDEQGLQLSTGNAGGFQVIVDGQELPPLGNDAQVKRNISLNPADLLKTIEN
jgi:cytoskeleton protein RodZ